MATYLISFRDQMYQRADAHHVGEHEDSYVLFDEKNEKLAFFPADFVASVVRDGEHRKGVPDESVNWKTM